MTYTKRPSVLMLLAMLFMEAYFFADYYVATASSRLVASLLPFFVVAIGGVAFLAQSPRNAEGTTVRWARLTVTALVIAVLAPLFVYIVVSMAMGVFGSSLRIWLVPAAIEIAVVLLVLYPPLKMTRRY